jgi:hypothetical protein
MSGQQPRQAPDERWYSSGQGPSSGPPPWPTREPERPRKEKRDKESKIISFREWLSTTAGTISAICAVVTLIGGTIVVVKILNNNPSTNTPTPGPTVITNPTSSDTTTQKPSGSFSAAQLKDALLPSSAVGSSAIVQESGTDLSNIVAICGGPVSGDTAAAYETIEDNQTGTGLDETLVSWNSTSGPSQGIQATRQSLDQSGSCSVTYNGVTIQYTGDEPGSPPSSCKTPGQYLATQAEITSPSFTYPDFGFMEIVQCGSTTIFVRVYSDVPGAMTKQAADGYLSSAVGQLSSTN